MHDPQRGGWTRVGCDAARYGAGFVRGPNMSTALPQVDAAGFARVYERHHQALYRYCRSILRHEQDAQDALQSAMTRAFAALQTERRDLEMRPWLFRIAHNEAVTILRRRDRTSALDESVGVAGALEDRVLERETLRLLRHDLADLPERQRCALVLRELNGLGHGEIADVLGITPAAVKQAIFEGRSALLRCRDGRDAACDEIRRILSDGDGRVLRSQRVRAHLRACGGCRSFRADLGRRPRDLALLTPPLPGGAGLLRWLLGWSSAPAAGGGLAAKAAIVVALAGGSGAAAIHSHAVGPRDSLRPAPAHAAAPARPAGAPVVSPAIRPRRPGVTGIEAAASPPATNPAAARSRPTPPREAQKTGSTAAKPLGQSKKGPAAIALGQAEKTGATRAGPLGQSETATDSHTAPARAKKASDVLTPLAKAKKTGSAPAVPPSRAKKRSAVVPSGQSKKPPEAVPPGQAKKPPAAVPSGQWKKPPAAAVPPGQAKKPPDTLPPGQSKKPPDAIPPGQSKQPPDAVPPTRTPEPAPPGQAKRTADAVPPGQAKKTPDAPGE